MEGFRTAYDWYNKGYINSDIMQSSQQPLGGFFAQWYMLKPGKDRELSAAYDEPVVQVGTTEVLTRTGDLQGSMMAISRTSKHPDLAIKVLELMNTDKTLNNMINFGIEGVHYTKVSDNVISRTDATPNYSPNGGWIFQNQFLNYLWDTEDQDKWVKFEEFNDSSRISEILGFVFDTSKVETEIAALYNITAEYKQVVQGVIDPDIAVPEAIDKFYKAGMQTVLDEANRQLEEFFATKNQ
jgi:putative aldouronate transport system substrate-binding protein